MKNLIIILLSFLLLGCSVPTEVADASNDPIKIGFLMGLTGPIAAPAESMKSALDLALEEINFLGGINGKKIEVIYEDTKCEPKEAATGAQKLISQDKVIAIVGAGCSSATFAAAPIANQAKVVMISPASTNPDITNAGEYIFRVVPSDSFQGKVGAELANRWGIKKTAVFYVNNDYGLALANVFSENFQNSGGIVTIKESHEQGSQDFRTQLTKIKATNPELIYLVGYVQEAGQILRQIKELGINVRVLASEGVKDPATIEVAGTAAEGVTITIPKPNDDKNFRDFDELYQARYREESGIFAAETYDAFMMIVNALKSNNGQGGEALKVALENLKDYPGASGTMTFDANGDVAKEISTVSVQNGLFVD